MIANPGINGKENGYKTVTLVRTEKLVLMEFMNTLKKRQFVRP
jgi:hypothetical protein